MTLVKAKLATQGAPRALLFTNHEGGTNGSTDVKTLPAASQQAHSCSYSENTTASREGALRRRTDAIGVLSDPFSTAAQQQLPPPPPAATLVVVAGSLAGSDDLGLNWSLNEKVSEFAGVGGVTGDRMDPACGQGGFSRLMAAAHRACSQLTLSSGQSS